MSTFIRRGSFRVLCLFTDGFIVVNYIDPNNPIREINRQLKGSNMETTLATPRPTITEFQDRVKAVVNHQYWPRVRNQFHREIIETAHVDLRKVHPKELERSLVKVESLLIEMTIISRRNGLDKERQGTVVRKWYRYFKQDRPSIAMILEAELPEPNECTHEQLDQLRASIDVAKLWSREQHERRMKDLQARCDDAQANTYVFKEFRLDHPEAYALIVTGPEDNTNLNPLVGALRDFDRLERELVGTPERILRDMGVSTEEVGKNNRSKGSKAKRLN